MLKQCPEAKEQASLKEGEWNFMHENELSRKNNIDSIGQTHNTNIMQLLLHNPAKY